ncbi:hypothetical protein pb186bvf_002506 [Paramecium bursaria]
MFRKLVRHFSTYPFQDIFKLRKVTPNEEGYEGSDEKTFYFYFQSQKIQFESNQSVLELCYNIQKQISDVTSVSVHYNVGNHQYQYAAATPLFLVIQEDMVIRLNQNENYVVLNEVDKPPIIDTTTEYPITQHPIQEYFADVAVTSRTRTVLSHFIQKMLNEIEKNQAQQYDKNILNLIVKKVILKLGNNSKAQKALIEQEISFLRQKEVRLSALKREAEKELEQKHQTQLQKIYFYLISQIIFTQYGTYWVWGWGVMEPITYMIGIFDLIIAYIFWMRTTKAYSFENVLKVAISKHIDDQLEQKFHYKDELNDVQLMIEYLNFKSMIFSSNIQDILNVIEGAIEEKQARLQEEEVDDQ